MNTVEKAWAIGPNNIDALIFKGDILFALGNYTGDAKYYDKARAIGPNNIDTLIFKGDISLMLGNYTGS